MTRIHRLCCLSLGIACVAGGSLFAIAPALALPPPEEVPEEVLRTEIITEARSPLNGELLTAAEYAELQAQLAASEVQPPVSPQVANVIRLLYLRQAIRNVFPFLLR